MGYTLLTFTAYFYRVKDSEAFQGGKELIAVKHDGSELLVGIGHKLVLDLHCSHVNEIVYSICHAITPALKTQKTIEESLFCPPNLPGKHWAAWLAQFLGQPCHDAKRPYDLEQREVETPCVAPRIARTGFLPPVKNQPIGAVDLALAYAEIGDFDRHPAESDSQSPESSSCHVLEDAAPAADDCGDSSCEELEAPVQAAAAVAAAAVAANLSMGEIATNCRPRIDRMLLYNAGQREVVKKIVVSFVLQCCSP